MPGERVEFASNGSKGQGYLATPVSGSGPGLIVIQEWWGLVAHIKAVADRFASAGFVALAPDLYRGEFAKGPDEAGRLMMALVDFYGVHPNVTLGFSRLASPVLGLFGERDSFVTPEVAQELQHALESAGKSVDFHIYSGADHAFFNDTRADVYNPEAARDAWRRTLDFLRANLA